jgi:predicted RNA-binding protein with PIN domain
MAIHLIIDGYNIIRQSARLSSLEAGDLEAGRQALLACLTAYRRSRPQHKITVVFDGWQTGGYQENRDVLRGMIVIFSRRGERADEVIKRLLTKEGQRAVLASSDRELQDWAKRCGAIWINAGQFEQSYLQEGPESLPAEEEASSPGRGSQKKGPAHRPSKRQRQRQQRLRKL